MFFLPSKHYRACLIIATAIISLTLASCGTTRRVTIRGFERLFITDLATDNTVPTAGAAGAVSVPIEGVPMQGQFQQGGILSANEFLIEGATGATIVIERGVSGNHNIDVDSALQRVFLPSKSPFKDILIEEDSSIHEYKDGANK